MGPWRGWQRDDPSRRGIVYDCRDATIGDVELNGAAESRSRPLFEHLRFLSTTFDGFEFGPHKDALSAAGQIHTVIDGVEFDDTEQSSAALLANTEPEAFGRDNLDTVPDRG
jgi:hypothetical protein